MMAEKFFDLAVVTAECCSDEEYLRSAISRIYFATHLLAVQKAAGKYENFAISGRAEDHGDVIRAPTLGRPADSLASFARFVSDETMPITTSGRPLPTAFIARPESK